jgi:hypothetical protein
MSEHTAFIIEAEDFAAGIVVQERGGFRFYAADRRLQPLEGQVFRSTRAAERAVARLAAATTAPAVTPLAEAVGYRGRRPDARSESMAPRQSR